MPDPKLNRLHPFVEPAQPAPAPAWAGAGPLARLAAALSCQASIFFVIPCYEKNTPQM